MVLSPMAPRARAVWEALREERGEGREQQGSIVRNRMLLLAGSEQGFCLCSGRRELWDGKQVTPVGD